MRTLYRLLAIGLIGLAVAGGGYFALQSNGAQAAAPAASIPEIVIQGHDFAFSGPDQIEAGLVGITLENQGHEPHQANIARLRDGKTFEDLMAAFKQSEMAAMALLDFVGGPNTVDPGLSQRVVINVEPGTYVLLCFVPSADGAPHIVKGMVRPLTVTARAGQPAGAEPQADVTATLKDFSVVLPAAIKAGPQTWKVTNDGPQPHELTLIKLAPGKTMADFMAFMQKPAGAPPFADVGGMGALMTGKSAWASLDLQPGDYIALCFVPDPASGKAHLELGMHTAFTVAAQPVALPLTGQESASALGLIVALGAVALLIAGVAVWLRARKAS